MMEKIRVAANHIVVKIIFALIILSFIFAGASGIFGIGSGGDDSQYIARVNGEGLSRAGFEAQAKVATDKAVSLGGGDAFEKEIRRGVLANQIDNYIAYNFSNQLDTKISNEQVINVIRQQPIFSENGKFSNKLYLELLALNGYTPEAYAEALRSEIQQKQAVSALMNSDFVLPVDSDISLLKNQVRTVYATTINPSIVKTDDVVVSEEDVEKYYNENLNSFFHPERVKIKFVANYRPDIELETSVSEAEIKKAYEQDTKTYSVPAKHSYSVIDVQEQDQANEVYDALVNGANFTEMVKSFSVSTKGKKGGSLGWFSVDDTLPQMFVDANLTKKGSFSKPIKTDDGFIIVKLDDIQPKQKMSLEYATPLIKPKLLEEKVNQKFMANNELLQNGLSEGLSSVDELAKQSGLKSYETEWSYRNERFSIVRFPEINEFVFNNLAMNNNEVTGELSDIIYVDEYKSTYVVQIVDYQPEGISPFEDVKDQILADLKLAKTKASFHEAVGDIVNTLESGAKVNGVSFSQRYNLSRTSDALDTSVVNMVFSLVPSADGKSVYGVSFSPDNQQSATIVTMIKVDTPTEAEDLSSQLRLETINNTYYYLASDLRSKAKIEIMPNSGL